MGIAVLVYRVSMAEVAIRVLTELMAHLVFLVTLEQMEQTVQVGFQGLVA